MHRNIKRECNAHNESVCPEDAYVPSICWILRHEDWGTYDTHVRKIRMWPKKLHGGGLPATRRFAACRGPETACIVSDTRDACLPNLRVWGYNTLLRR